MRCRYLLFAVVLVCLSSVVVDVALASSNPIPGVGFTLPAGFFGPGSEPFDGFVTMEGQCSHSCGGCDDNCASSPGSSDSRMDYSMDVPTGPFDMTMHATTMYSVAPIQVMINGVASFFDVSVEMSGPAPANDDDIVGTMALAPGESLDVGTSAHVLSSSLDVFYTITFADASTGIAAGTAITGELETVLKNLGLLATRVAAGGPGGTIVMGYDGSSTAQFTYASSNDDLVLNLLSLYQSGPVPTTNASWGAVKALYR